MLVRCDMPNDLAGSTHLHCNVGKTYLAPIARLTRPLGVGQLLLDRAGKVIAVRRAVLWAQRVLMLDALDLGDEIGVIIRGSLRGHTFRNARRNRNETGNADGEDRCK
jgi:hypothetical protein